MADLVEELFALTQAVPSDRRAAARKALDLLENPDVATRAAAVDAIAVTCDPKAALEALGKLARDSDAGVKLAATAAIAGLPWRARLDVLAGLLDDKDTGIAFAAADGLAHAGDDRGVRLLLRMTAVRALRFAALESLLALDVPALEPLARRLASAFFTNPFERALAAVVLASHGDEASRRLLRSKLEKKRAEERPFVVVHLARVDPVEGRRLIEALAQAPDEYLRESALLALAKLDAAWWNPASDAIRRFAEEDPHTAAEMLLGLFDVDAEKAASLAEAHVARDGELGIAARQVRLKAALRREFPDEVLLRCA